MSADISRPVSLEAVYRVLGVAQAGGRYDLAHICGNSHGKINMWAKYKPERINTPLPVNDGQRQFNNFGLRPRESYGSVQQAIDAIKAGALPGWAYEAPRPGTDFSRLSDFDGYKADANSPFGVLRSPVIISLPKTGGMTLTIPVLVPFIGEGVISMDEFSMGADAYKDWYPGAVMYNARRTFVATRAQTFAQTGDSAADWSIDLGTATQSDDGDYTAALIISSKAIQPGVWPQNPKIVFVGDTADVVIKPFTDTATRSMSVRATRVKSGSDVSVRATVTFYNETGSAAVFSGVYVRMAKDDTGTGQTAVQALGDVTVPGGGTATREVSVNLTAMFGTAEPQYRFIRATSSTANAADSPWTAIMDAPPDPGIGV